MTGVPASSSRQLDLILDIAVDSPSVLAVLRAGIGDSPLIPDAINGKVQLVVTELATNTLAYAGGTGRVRLWCTVDLLMCEVSDCGPGIATAIPLTMPGLLQHGGRGLFLCREFSTDLRIEGGTSGTTVTAVFALAPPDR